MNSRKILRRTALGIPLLALVSAAALVVVVHTDMFRHFVLTKIIQKANEKLGGRLTIERMAIDWRPLEVDFYGLILHGGENSSEPPLFVAEHLRIVLKVASILQARVDVKGIVLDRPVVHLRVDSKGNSNLPRPPVKPELSSSSAQDTFSNFIDMAIQHVEFNSGVLFYNDEEVPLSAELRDVQARVFFNRLVPEYRGKLAYGDGHIVIENFKPVAHKLELAFNLGRSGIQADPITLTTEQSALKVHAKIADYADPHVTATYDGILSTGEVLRLTNSAPVTSGTLAVAGGLAYHSVANQPWIENLNVTGKVTGEKLLVAAGRKSVDARSVRGNYRLQGGNLSVRNIEADVLGGRISASYELINVIGNSSSRLEGVVQNASLQNLNDAAATPKLGTIRLIGRVDGTVKASWGSRIQDGIARVHVVIRNPNQVARRGTDIPLNGLMDMEYDGARQSASFGDSYLKTGNTTATVNGILSSHSRLSAEINTSDLHELGELMTVLQQDANLGNNPWLTGLGGSARFKGQVLGSITNPIAQGELSANNLQIQKTRWRSLNVNVDAASAAISLRNGSLNDMQKGRITFDLNANLQGWSFRRSNPISLQLTAKDISIADLQQFTQSNYPIRGILAAKISLTGSVENPEGQGSLQISQASAWNEPFNTLSADFKGDGASIHSTLQIAAPAGNVAGELTYLPKTQSYDASLKTSGIRLERLQLEQIQSLGVSGSVAFDATGHGSFQDPQVTANLQIPQLRIRDWAVSDVQVRLDSANDRANFVLTSKADQASIQAKGDLGLSGEYPANASIEIRAIPMGVILAKYLPQDQKVQGEADLLASLKGPLKNPTEIAAQVEIPKLNVTYQSATMSTGLALVRPLHLKYANGLATLEEAQFKGNGTNLTLAGTIPVKSAQPLNVSANGAIDLSLLQGFARDVRSSGRIDLNLTARGELTNPTMQGQVHIVDARLATDTMPVGLEGITGLIQVSGNRIEIAQFSGAAGGGTVSAHGFMTYGRNSAFNLGLDLKSVRLRYPEGIRSLLTGNLALNGSEADSRLTGRVVIDRLSFTQQFDLANFLGQFSTETTSAPISSVERNMKLNVAVATSEDMNLANSKVSVEGSANLTLIGTMANPVVLGRTTLTSGDMFFMGKRYEIQNGTIQFVNPIRTTPVLNLYVTTTVQQYNIRLNFVGPINRLRTNYTSDPPLPSADIVNLVAFGKTSEQAATSPSTPASVGAESVLAQGVTGQVSGKIERLTGISQLTIDPLAGNSQTNPGSRVAIQQRVSGNILFTFSTDVTSTQNQAVQVQYQAKKNLSISVLRDQYGGYAADIKIHKNF
jgi:translocation and assembly module TamB